MTDDAVLHQTVLPGPDGAPVDVARLVDGAGSAATSVPRPYLHPVQTLGRTVVSAHHPADHDWHCGVGWAIPDVDGTNCWGGPTYVDGSGSVWRDDHGSVTADRVTVDGASHTVDATWRGDDGRPLLHEQRTTTARALGPDAWELRTTSTFRVAGPTAVELGGPGSHGRVGAGYGGLFWRFPECSAIDVRTADGSGEPAVHGAVTPWVAWSAQFAAGPATVALQALNHRDPWFVRADEYPAIGSASPGPPR